jgi:hypothetical protein
VQTELSAHRVLLFGLVGLIVALAVAIQPLWFAVAACCAYLALLAVGCTFIPDNKMSATWMAEVPLGASLVLLDEDVAQTYPQLLVFRTRLKNLWLLPICVVIALAALFWLLKSKHDVGLAENFYLRLACAPAAYLGWKWAHERYVIKKQIPVLGLLSSTRENLVRYQFFFDGERYGDMGNYFGWSSISPLIVVFVDPQNPARHEPSFNLVFHSVEIMDRVHWPEERLASVEVVEES